MRSRFDYDITAAVLDETGRELATKSAKNSGQITNFLTAGADAIGSVLNADEIAAALSGPVPPIVTTPRTPATQATPSSGYDDCMRRIVRIKDPQLRASAMVMCDGVK